MTDAPRSVPPDTAADHQTDDRDFIEIASVDRLDDRPLRRWVRTAMVGDLLVALIITTVARIIRFGTDPADVSGDTLSISYVALGITVTILWPILNAFCGSYDYRASLFGIEEIRRVIRSGIGLLCALAVSYFALQLSISRAYALILVPSLVFGTAVWRFSLRRQQGRRQRRGLDRHRAVAIGPLDEVYRVCSDLLTRPSSPIELVGYLLDDDTPADADAEVDVRFGSLRRLYHRDDVDALQAEGVRVDLLLRAGQPPSEELWSLARWAHEARVAMAISPARTDAANVGFSYLPLGATPLLMVETPSLKPAHQVAKAIVDRVVGALMLLVLTPFWIAIGLAIKLSDPGPILFRQTRVGRDGHQFRLFKFRSMHVGAESSITELDERNEASGLLFKIRDDPRVSRIGRFMRRYSIDELPQLLNVVRGEMSLVGPRPPLPIEVASYDERTARRLLVRPGMTGLWQVSGRSDLGWDEGIYLDVLYVDHWSPLLDLAIIARTIVAVLRPRGAY